MTDPEAGAPRKPTREEAIRAFARILVAARTDRIRAAAAEGRTRRVGANDRDDEETGLRAVSIDRPGRRRAAPGPPAQAPAAADGWPARGAYASSADVAEYLALPVSTVQMYARKGVLPGIRLGGRNGPLRFRKLDVEKWISRQPRANG